MQSLLLILKHMMAGTKGFIHLVFILKKDGMATNSGLFSHHIKE